MAETHVEHITPPKETSPGKCSLSNANLFLIPPAPAGAQIILTITPRKLPEILPIFDFTPAGMGRMERIYDRIQIHPDENLAAALRELPGIGVLRGHKVALRDIAA